MKERRKERKREALSTPQQGGGGRKGTYRENLRAQYCNFQKRRRNCHCVKEEKDENNGISRWRSRDEGLSHVRDEHEACLKGKVKECGKMAMIS